MVVKEVVMEVLGGGSGGDSWLWWLEWWRKFVRGGDGGG
jgi:hypothetical protein